MTPASQPSIPDLGTHEKSLEMAEDRVRRISRSLPLRASSSGQNTMVVPTNGAASPVWVISTWPEDSIVMTGQTRG